MSWGNEPKIISRLNSFSLDEIQQGIDELESTISLTVFGKRCENQLIILYMLKEQAEKKRLSYEISTLKKQLFERLAETMSDNEARCQAFNIWVKYNNQAKGAQYVRDSLQMELEKEAIS